MEVKLKKKEKLKGDLKDLFIKNEESASIGETYSD